MRGLILSLVVAASAAAPVMADEQAALNTVSLLPVAQPGSIPLSSGVKDLADIVKHFKRTLNDIKNECSRRQQMEICNPWFEDGFYSDPYYEYSMMYPWVDNPPIEFQADGPPLPPRKDFLNHYMAQLDQLQNMLQNEVRGIALPQDAPQLVSVDWQIVSDQVKKIQQDENDIRVLIQADKPDAKAIVTKSEQIKDDVTGIDDIRKKIITLVK